MNLNMGAFTKQNFHIEAWVVRHRTYVSVHVLLRTKMYIFCGGGIKLTWKEGKSFLFFLPPICHGSTSVVENHFSCAKEQSSCNEAQLQFLTIHDLS